MSQYLSPYHQWFRQSPDQATPPPPPAGATALTSLPIIPPPPPPPLPQSSSSSSSSSSPFFSLLPAEVRTQILTAAFGAREIHVDLSFNRVATTHPHHTAGASYLPTRTWAWRSSVCHRLPDRDYAHDECSPGGYQMTCDPANDAAADPSACYVGAHGWLLACRQAYAEGLAVLYGSNAWHVQSGALLLFGPRLLSPAGLACVASLTVLLDRATLYAHAAEHLGLRRGWPAFWALVLSIGATFPALRRLRVGFNTVAPDREAFRTSPLGMVAGTFMQPPRDPCDEFLWGVAPPFDRLVRQYGPQLRDCEVVLLNDLYDAWTRKEKAAATRVETGPRPRDERFWRSVVPSGDGKGGDGELGYWIRRQRSRYQEWVDDHDLIYAFG
ncbi:uncharacterized protein E0L32_000741 [Thyridium curvatum]|uniref:DUF7730 domain-containing protein n=1 Tax=Thyridium curvatum TaxID=1093900 RepID=A0A507B1H6_9PEZI|nr:uncharacterized protein E0L32_000741 [Thyridium curvatum]TPX12564.1 hypothetical protein E0L32_000741 [Thyridium curvatum]